MASGMDISEQFFTLVLDYIMAISEHPTTSTTEHFGHKSSNETFGFYPGDSQRLLWRPKCRRKHPLPDPTCPRFRPPQPELGVFDPLLPEPDTE